MIQTRRRKRLRVFRIDSQRHDVMRVTFKDLSSALTRALNPSPTHLNTSPSLVPVPALDRHIITPRQDHAQRRVHRQTSDIIGMSLERRDLLSRRDVVDA